jgi:hypothetical protein
MSADARAKPRPYKIKVVKAKRQMSELEHDAVDTFRKAIQKEYALLAKRKVATVVMVDGKMIRGIPKRVKGRYVVSKS